jgi:ribonuclease HI
MQDLLTGYADAGYLSDPDDSKSQTGYVFLQGTTTISWKSSKQTLTTTSSNHAEVIALYEACRKCVQLRQLINHINTTIGKAALTRPTTIYEDNQSCVNQIAKGYIKGDRIKHIAPKFFYAHEQHGDSINVEWIPTVDNRHLTKPLPPTLHRAHTYGIGMRRLIDLLQDDKENFTNTTESHT